MSMEDEFKTLLSGELSRRRGYLSNMITAINGLAVTGTLTIWITSIKWDLLYGQSQNHIEFAIRLAWASGVSSFILGLWRFYARFLDASIIRLYPAIYLCELHILPAEIVSIKPPKLPENVTTLTKENLSQNIGWHDAQNGDFGGRGHQFIDILVGIFLCTSLGIILWVSYDLSVISFVLGGKPHLISYLLLGNLVGLLLVIAGWWKWKNKKVRWPIDELKPSINNIEAQPINSADAKSRAAD